jgi:hypothetical protein
MILDLPNFGHGTGSNAGAGSLDITGQGTVELSGANTYTGGTSLGTDLTLTIPTADLL